MFKKTAIAAVFVGALALGGLGAASQAQAGHHHHCHGGPAYVPYAAYYPAPHVRSAYYGGYHPRSTAYSPYYGRPSYYSGYGVYSRGPAFRLSVGF